MIQIAWGDKLLRLFRSVGLPIWVRRIFYVLSLIFFLLSLGVFLGDHRTPEVATAERISRQYDYKLEEIAKLESQGKGEEWAEKLLSSMRADLAELEKGKKEMNKLASLSQKSLTSPVATYYLYVSVFLFAVGYLTGRPVKNL